MSNHLLFHSADQDIKTALRKEENEMEELKSVASKKKRASHCASMGPRSVALEIMIPGFAWITFKMVSFCL